jgi:hypothetical protein
MNKLMQMKAAMAMEKASESEGGSGMGMGTGLRLLINCPLKARTGAFILFQPCAPTAAGIWMEKRLRWFCCAKIVHLPGIRLVKS